MTSPDTSAPMQTETADALAEWIFQRYVKARPLEAVPFVEMRDRLRAVLHTASRSDLNGDSTAREALTIASAVAVVERLRDDLWVCYAKAADEVLAALRAIPQIEGQPPKASAVKVTPREPSTAVKSSSPDIINAWFSAGEPSLAAPALKTIGVTEAMVDAAREKLACMGIDDLALEEVRAAIEAALAAREPTL